MRIPGSHRRAFSLIEVVIAVGIFAVAVTVTLALLPALARQAGESGDLLSAQRLPDAVRIELQRLAQAGGYDALRANLPPMNAPLPDGLEFTASRDAARLHSAGYLPPAAQIPPDEQYFAVEGWRIEPGQLDHDPGAALLVHVRVSWPFRLPQTAGPTPLADRHQFTFTVSIVR